QTDVAPPTIVLFVNKVEYLNDSYRRFVVNRFRELLPYAEIPINLVVRGREPRETAHVSLDETPPGEKIVRRPEGRAEGRPMKPRPKARSGAAGNRRPTK